MSGRLVEGARILDAGECALVIEFGDRVDLALHDRVLALDAAIAANPIDGVQETVPTYRSLMVHYDPLVLPREGLLEALQALPDEHVARSERCWRMPVTFDPELADDLHDLAVQLDVPVSEVERRLLGSRFRVFMYGFAPGFAYLGGVDPALRVPRRATPRPSMPPSSVIIASGLAAIGSVAMPTGWYVVANTPLAMFDAERDGFVPFEVGDELVFEAVDRSTHGDLARRALAGEPIAKLAA